MNKQYVTGRLMFAVITMREACDEAERAAKDGDMRSARRVLNRLSWGFANATTNIESAMSAIEDAHTIALDEAKRNEIGADE
jgi:hypothetical protein